MTDNKSEFERVHVLRQIFRPNDPLREAFSELVTTGSNGPRPFSVYGVVERLINMSYVGSSELDIQQRNAAKIMETKRNAHFGLKPGVNGRLLTSSAKELLALQLVMEPARVSEYLRIQHDGLDAIKLGKLSRAIGSEATQLYMNIPVSQIRSIPRIKEGLVAINETLSDESTRHLYQLTLLPYLVGQSVTRPVPKPKEADNRESQAS